MKNNPVGWFEIYVQDMGRARAFYERVLDGQLTRLDTGDLEMWAFPMGDAKGIGGALVREKFSIGPYGFVALAKDTEGNMIGLHSQR